MDIQPFCGKEPHLLCVGLQAAYGGITISGAHDNLNNGVIFIECISAGHII
jgi:hypothetical protein